MMIGIPFVARRYVRATLDDYYCRSINNDNYTNDNDYDSDVLVVIIFDTRSAMMHRRRRLSHLDFII